jgi:hypothetical protein
MNEAVLDRYGALAVAILHPKYLTVETACLLYDEGTAKAGGYVGGWTDEDVDDVGRMRDAGLTWREIGDIYGVTECTIYTRYKRGRAGRRTG